MRARRITKTDLDDHILHRREETASNAPINRELCAIMRPFNLMIRNPCLSGRRISLPDYDNSRLGFIERERYESLRKLLPDACVRERTLVPITRWLKSEIPSLQRRQIVRLEAWTTENREKNQGPLSLRDTELS